ncbi:MAG: hypothetical protein GX575_07495 [Candidatus Anammoximicrobium sp.]|nr:hypothetical protein [Candidatus Anammoximicrobium sp.]
MGPCYPFVKQAKVYDKLAAPAGKLGFDEIPSRDAVRERPEVLDSVSAQQAAPGASGSMSLADEDDPVTESQSTSKVPFEPD